MEALYVMNQNDGYITRRYYAELGGKGPLGEIAVAIFRAQKRSSRAKDYKRGKYRGAAYDVKQWSMGEICKLIDIHGKKYDLSYGWKTDPNTLFGESASWVLYVDLPEGQVSFHSPSRGPGPAYAGDWDGQRGMGPNRVAAFCDRVMRGDDARLGSFDPPGPLKPGPGFLTS